MTELESDSLPLGVTVQVEVGIQTPSMVVIFGIVFTGLYILDVIENTILVQIIQIRYVCSYRLAMKSN